MPDAGQTEPRAAANARVVRAYVDAFNRGDVEALRRLFTPDAVIYGVLGAGGLDVVAPIWKELHDTFAVELHVDGLVAQAGPRRALNATSHRVGVGRLPAGYPAAPGLG